jgi:hypothetical protein
MSRQGIMKAIHQGKLSAQKDLNGQWQIEPVELFRVYQPVSGTQPEATSGTEDTPKSATVARERENEILWKMLADKDDVIEDLRARLDSEAEERRKLTMILTDVQHQQAPTVLPEATTPTTESKRSWAGALWARLCNG